MGSSPTVTQTFESKMFSTLLTFSLFLASCIAGPLEQAPYEVVADHEGWQERSYPPTRWVSTDYVDIFAHDGLEHMKAFQKLFLFITGANCSSSVTMSFLVPGYLQETTPEPTDASVYLEDRPAMRFVTKQFSGFPDELDWTMQAAELFELATAAGLQPKTEPHWTAGYDGPSVIVNRRNEVWLELDADI